MKILSLCDGMSCGRVALERAGIKVEAYYAAEIKAIGIETTTNNYPDTVHIGDVNLISYESGILHTGVGDYNVGHIDLVIFGSPCQTFSLAMKTDKRVGLANLEKSGLFYQCNRILKEVKPSYFLMENVASMKKSDRETISEYLGVPCITIEGAKVGPALRKRCYWTNIPSVKQPEDKHILLGDILTNGYTDREKARCLLVSDSRPLSTPVKMFHRYYSTGFTTLIFKDRAHYESCVAEYERIKRGKESLSAQDLDSYTGTIFDGVRYLNQDELEKCHGVPAGYTRGLTRNQAADIIGDGWQIDVIAHIFTYLKKEADALEAEDDDSWLL